MGWGASVTQWLPNSLYRISTLGLLPFLIVPQRVSRPSCQAYWQPCSPSRWKVLLGGFLYSASLSLKNCQRIEQPVLLNDSSLQRLRQRDLVSYLPNAQKTLLPESGHACLLETEVKLGDILQLRRFYGN
jgi:hypothetical protein